jgi:hypothetical protein
MVPPSAPSAKIIRDELADPSKLTSKDVRELALARDRLRFVALDAFAGLQPNEGDDGAEKTPPEVAALWECSVAGHADEIAKAGMSAAG